MPFRSVARVDSAHSYFAAKDFYDTPTKIKAARRKLSLIHIQGGVSAGSSPSKWLINPSKVTMKIKPSIPVSHARMDDAFDMNLYKPELSTITESESSIPALMEAMVDAVVKNSSVTNIDPSENGSYQTGSVHSEIQVTTSRSDFDSQPVESHTETRILSDVGQPPVEIHIEIEVNAESSEVQPDIDASSDEFQTKIDPRLEEVQLDIDPPSHIQLQIEINQQLEEIRTDIDPRHAEVRLDIDQESEEVRQYIERLTEVQLNIDQQLEEIRAEMDTMPEEFGPLIDAISIEIESDINPQSEEVQSVINPRFEEVHPDVDWGPKEVQLDIDQGFEEIQACVDPRIEADDVQIDIDTRPKDVKLEIDPRCEEVRLDIEPCSEEVLLDNHPRPDEVQININVASIDCRTDGTEPGTDLEAQILEYLPEKKTSPVELQSGVIEINVGSTNSNAPEINALDVFSIPVQLQSISTLHLDTVDQLAHEITPPREEDQADIEYKSSDLKPPPIKIGSEISVFDMDPLPALIPSETSFSDMLQLHLQLTKPSETSFADISHRLNISTNEQRLRPASPSSNNSEIGIPLTEGIGSTIFSVTDNEVEQLPVLETSSHSAFQGVFPASKSEYKIPVLIDEDDDDSKEASEKSSISDVDTEYRAIMFTDSVAALAAQHINRSTEVSMHNKESQAVVTAILDEMWSVVPEEEPAEALTD